jgi:hypothetical protein
MDWSDVASLIGAMTGLAALALTLLDRRERSQGKAAAQAEHVWIMPAGPSGTLELDNSVRRVAGATYAPRVINDSHLPLRDLEVTVTATTTPEVEGSVRSPRPEPHETVMPQIQVRGKPREGEYCHAAVRFTDAANRRWERNSDGELRGL